ncbi:insulinase family protein [Candidatus Marinimicrobia bacterium MT.SAG.4]|nr:insulinase family protein [Candidatus Marinimicrobia bacterium MT.SAG.4]
MKNWSNGMNRLHLFTALLLIFTLSNCSTKQASKPSAESFEPPLSTPIPINPAVKIGVLDNGIKYLIRVNHKPEKRAELRLVVNVGSVLEADDQQGLAHFAEHMAFNGTEHFEKQEIIDYLESIGTRFGPDLNAYTSFDETVYMLRIPTDSSEIVEKAFLILEDWAKGITFADEEIDKERGVVIEEWRLGQGAEMRMFNKQLPILFKDSRYAERLPIGKKEILESFSYETLKRFYKDWYRPELMSVIAVGDFDPEWIESIIRENFGRVPASESIKTREIFRIPDHTETLTAIASDPEATGSRIAIYYKMNPKEQNSHGAYREGIITNLYNNMLNSRFRELTTKPDAPFLYGFSAQGRFVRTKEVYFLGAGVGDNGIYKGVKALLTEAERIARHGFTKTELERNKVSIMRNMEKAYLERDKTNSRSYASEYIRHFLVGEPIPGIEYEYELYKQYLPGISVKEINELARSWLPDENRVVLINLPEKKGIEEVKESDLLALFSSVKSLTLKPYIDAVSDAPLLPDLAEPSAVMSTRLIEEVDLHEVILSNNVRIFMKKTDFKNDEILMRAYSKGGRSLLSDEDIVAGRTATDIIRESGYGTFNKTQLQKKLAGKLVRVSPYIGSMMEGISGSSTPEDLETMFQLIHLIFQSPRKDTTAFLAYKERMKGFLQNIRARPEQTFQDTVTAIMSQYSPRYRPWSIDFIDEFDLERSYEIFRERFADIDGFTFVFVGNFEIDELTKLAQTYLGSLPALIRNENWLDDEVDPPIGVVKRKVFKGQEPKSVTQFAFTGDFEWNRQNRYELESMAKVLNIKLREILREDLGGTYGARVRAIPQEIPDPEYRIDISFGSAPERVSELTKAVLLQIDSLKNFGTTDKYLTKVKEIQRRSRETDLKENGFWVRALENIAIHDEDYSNFNTYDSLVESLTLETIQNAALKYLNDKNYVQISLFPEGFVE